MKKLKWDTKMSVGVPSLDQEHNRIVSMINQLLEKIENQDVTNLNVILHELLQYSQEHFKHEERLFEELDFKEFNEHKQKHDDFIVEVKKFAASFLGQKEEKTVSKENGCTTEITIQGDDDEEMKKALELKKKLALASDITRFLFDWLINHVMHDDKKYSYLFKEKGAR